MARTVNEEEFTAKRNEILDIAQRHIDTKGYEQMSIQDIRRELGMSNGAFYHYFDSKAALLAAYIERGQDDLDKVFRAIVEDPSLSARDKFQRFFATLNRTRRNQQAFLADLVRVWFADDNAIVREKTDEVIVQRRAPLLNAIVRQGVQEGVFTTPYPDQAGQVLLSITRGMGNVVLKLILAFEQERDALHYIDEIVAASAAMAEAIERVLGSSVRIFDRPDAQAVKGWMVALSRNAEHTT
jgi:AcrR family transcriptional regulator